MRNVRSWLVAAALATPLVLISGWLLRGALAPTPRDEPPAPEGTSAPAPPAATPARAAVADGWPPALDLPAGRLEERVDGGADALRAAGCTRLLDWRSEAPAADLEALVFDTAEQARAALSREAGAARTPGPGDEAQVSDQAVYVRHGAVLLRAFADPGGTGGEALVALARRVEPQIARLP